MEIKISFLQEKIKFIKLIHFLYIHNSNDKLKADYLI